VHALDVQLHRLAATQHWLVTRDQAGTLGLTPRQVSLRLHNGALTRMHKGVYAVAGGPRTYEQSVLAACLSAGGVASHRTAAVLWRLRGFESGVIEVTVPVPHPPALAGVLCHRSRRLERADVTRLNAIPVSRVCRTLLDVGTVAPELFAGALEDALHRGLESVRSLERMLDRVGGNGRGGTAALRQALADRDPANEPTESALEDAFVSLMHRHRVPDLARQHRVTVADGRRIRLDFADPELKLDVEVDGRRWHSQPRDVQRDRRRDRILVALGWTVLRYSWDDVRVRGAEVVEEVTRVRHAIRSPTART
jgi:very-short-patch-repair endonuclease/predicted transcriptional regulator of viral defense system